ncbi:CopG family transcriptional regulator [Actinomycetaceae bacterium L2_0104]
MSTIDSEAMSAYVESDEFFDEPPAGRTLTGDEARAAGREVLERFAGRPNVGHTHAQGKGSSPRRQVRLPEALNSQLDTYAAETGQTASQVIRDALESFFEGRAA